LHEPAARGDNAGMTRNRNRCWAGWFAALLAAGVTAWVWAADGSQRDNTLSDAERREGWVLLFDGKSTDQWFVADRGPIPASIIQDGTINPHGVGSGRKVYLMYTKRTFRDFALALDFKVSKDCNSGVFLRAGEPNDPVQSGLEIQVFDSAGKTMLTKYDCGALYDAQAPSTNAMKPAGEWNHVEITAEGAKVRVVLNGQNVLDADVDRWTEPGRNPDGTKNKYKRALKDFPREGHVGLQDHNHDVWYRNLKIKPLGASRTN
jgi:hypothetical protein